MANDINLDSYFDEIIIDNNGNSIIDLNKGIEKLYASYLENAPMLSEEQRYLIREYEDGYPDLVATQSILGSQAYWWWILLLNNLEDPFEDLKKNWVYSINSIDTIQNIIDNTNNANQNKEESREGTIVELN